MSQKKKKENDKSFDDIQYYFDNNRFFDLLKRTKKYKDLFFSKEAFLSLLLSVITVILFLAVAKNSTSISEIFPIGESPLYKEDIKDVVDLSRAILNISIAGLFGLLGFIIGGLSILSGTISSKIIDSINDDGKIKYLIRIMFSFYYTGALIGVCLVLSIISYISTYTSFEMNFTILVFWSLIICYISYFTIITSVMLMGTSLRFFLLNYWYVKKNGKKD